MSEPDSFMVALENMQKELDAEPWYKKLRRWAGRLPSKLRDAKWWFYHRFHPNHKYYLIDTGLGPGYYDKDLQMLHGCFSILKDYVEHELAWMQLICHDEEKKKVPWYMSLNAYRNKNARRLGLEHLWWEMKLKMEHFDNGEEDPNSDLQINHEGTQGHSAKEQHDLYIWWTEERAKEWLDIDKNCGTDWGKYFQEEERLHQKDQDQLIRLMKIRQTLWT